MKLYDGGRAPNPRRVRIFLAEKGISIPMVQIDLATLEHKQAGYTAINPYQQLPALELDDGTVIGESVAICRYFERLQPEPPLFGSGAKGEALVEMWQRRAELGLFLPVAYAFRHLHPAMAAMEVPQVAEWGEVNKSRALGFLGLLETELSARPFLAGDSFSIADITAGIALEFMKPAKLVLPESYARIRNWYEKIAARPSWAA